MKDSLEDLLKAAKYIREIVVVVEEAIGPLIEIAERYDERERQRVQKEREITVLRTKQFFLGITIWERKRLEILLFEK